MKELLAKIAIVTTLAALSGCISVRDEEPESVTTTTRRTSVSTPVISPSVNTVERTTVY